jgi:hypothetical protein
MTSHADDEYPVTNKTVKPQRCALCNVRFYKNNKYKRRASACRGRVWRDEKNTYGHCYAWICRFDDQCEKAGQPCPYCAHIKKVEWSHDWGTFTPTSEIPDDAYYGKEDDDFVAKWYDRHGVLRTWYEA